MIEADELLLVKEAVLIPHLIGIVERNMDEMEQRRDPLTRAYLITAQTVINRIMDRQPIVRKELLNRKIKLIGNKTPQKGAAISYDFVAGGFRQELNLTRPEARAALGHLLAHYMDEVKQLMKATS
ncbi:hypothetical protein B8V81_5082 [Paenibacillus pasadenensis]|uniref:Phage protein n=1 Tax=Paenibacillus pasadenensis TaxID=217090 RepID=A0A2N5MZQ7_9BACL|nr:hypothetical protein [Paenibacillus pasadenensis]PLT43542.1 hypothetical protein B8V81_5082 [Paenibacillus pasadenensis]